MPVRFADVVADAKLEAPELADEQLECVLLKAIRRCGWDVSPGGEVYNPAEGAYRPEQNVVPRNDGRAYSKYTKRRR
jgi:hypothetical protein